MNRSKSRAKKATTKRVTRSTRATAPTSSRSFASLSVSTPSTSRSRSSHTKVRVAQSSAVVTKVSSNNTVQLASRRQFSLSTSKPTVAPISVAPQRSFTPKNVVVEAPAASFSAPVFKVSRPTFSEAQPIKYTTGISGLEVVPNSREVLESLYNHIIELSKSYQKRNTIFYNKIIENDAVWKLTVLKKYPNDDLLVERILGRGQLESLIQHAENDLMVLDLVNKHKPRGPDPEHMKNSPPLFNISGPHADAQIYPFPKAALEEVATGKATLIPGHPTKPFSLAYASHLGFQPTEKQLAEYAELMKLTPEEEEIKKKNLAAGRDFAAEDMTDMYLTTRLEKGEELDDEFWSFFEKSPAIYPHLDPKNAEEYERTWH